MVIDTAINFDNTQHFGYEVITPIDTKGVSRMDIFELLNALGIEFRRLDHEAVFTVEQSRQLRIFDKLGGQPCKNLFLRNKRGEFFLLTLPADKKADLKAVAKILQMSRLSFASEDELSTILNLHAGSVTPLGIVNDAQRKVKLIIDAELQGKTLLLHPNTNTATISIAFDDLIALIRHAGHEFSLVNLQNGAATV